MSQNSTVWAVSYSIECMKLVDLTNHPICCDPASVKPFLIKHSLPFVVGDECLLLMLLVFENGQWWFLQIKVEDIKLFSSEPHQRSITIQKGLNNLQDLFQSITKLARVKMLMVFTWNRVWLTFWVTKTVGNAVRANTGCNFEVMVVLKRELEYKSNAKRIYCITEVNLPHSWSRIWV